MHWFLKKMNCKEDTNRQYPSFACCVDNASYKVVFFRVFRGGHVMEICWASIFWNNSSYDGMGKYIAKNIRLMDLKNGFLREEHKFSTKEEAIAVCERHYKLLLLQ